MQQKGHSFQQIFLCSLVCLFVFVFFDVVFHVVVTGVVAVFALLPLLLHVAVDGLLMECFQFFYALTKIWFSFFKMPPSGYSYNGSLKELNDFSPKRYVFHRI